MKSVFKKKEKAPGVEGEDEWEEYWVNEDGEEIPVGFVTNGDDINPSPEDTRVSVPVYEPPTEMTVEEEEKEEAPKKGLFGFPRPPPKPEKPALKPMSWRKIEKKGEDGEEERPKEGNGEGKVSEHTN